MTRRLIDQASLSRSRQRGFLLNPFVFSSGSGSDPYWSNVVSLLHLNGTNASTTFTDVVGKTWTARSGAKLTTASQKFGTASLVLNGSSDSIDTPDSADWNFGSGDFTIECWINPVVVPAAGNYHGLICQRASSGNEAFAFLLNGDASTKLAFEYSTSGSGAAGTAFGPSAPTTGSWGHAAVCRSGTSLVVYWNGSPGTSVTIGTATIFNHTNVLAIGVLSNGSGYFNGSIDEVRITKGVARYTGSFTVPTAEFPNS